MAPILVIERDTRLRGLLAARLAPHADLVEVVPLPPLHRDGASAPRLTIVRGYLDATYALRVAKLLSPGRVVVLEVPGSWPDEGRRHLAYLHEVECLVRTVRTPPPWPSQSLREACGPFFPLDHYEPVRCLGAYEDGVRFHVRDRLSGKQLELHECGQPEIEDAYASFGAIQDLPGFVARLEIAAGRCYRPPIA